MLCAAVEIEGRNRPGHTLIFLLLQVPHPVLVLACVLLEAFEAALLAGVPARDGTGDALCSSPASGEFDPLSAIGMSGGMPRKTVVKPGCLESTVA